MKTKWLLENIGFVIFWAVVLFLAFCPFILYFIDKYL